MHKLRLLILLTLFFPAIVLCENNPAGPNVGPNAAPNVGIIQGTVKDSSGAVIPGATITISYISTNYKATTTTDENGNFRFVNVPFNPYKLEVEAAGFKKAAEDIDVHTNAPVQADMVLDAASVSEVVEVTTNTSEIKIEE